MAKAELLNRIRQRLGVTENDQTRMQDVNHRLEHHEPNTIPQMAKQKHSDLVDMFEKKISANQATVNRIADGADLSQAIADFLGDEESKLCINPGAKTTHLDFSSFKQLSVVPWTPKASLNVCVSTCFGAVAESGSLVVTTSAQNALTQNFLGEKHIVLLKEQDIVGAYEEIWNKLRQDQGMPRDLTLVSGPSCTGDIEMIMEYGAHGPRQLHIIIIGE